MLPVLWISGFVLGVAMFTPISSFSLIIDYYELVFPGQQVAVKATVCYEMTFVILQVICHLADARLPISRAARIQIRLICVSLIMVFIIIWERLIVGDVHNPNPAALPILLAVVTITGVFDGICVGAIFGEAAVLGPASAHALVAGTAGVMPLLAVLRIIFKATLPATTEGLVLSVALYFAAAAAVLLGGLAVYTFVVMPAVAAVVCCTFSGGAKQYADELGVLPLVPMLGAFDAADDLDEGPLDEEAGKRLRSHLTRHNTLAYSLALPASMRGMPVVVKRVHTGMNPTLLRLGTMEGAIENFALTETLQSRATAAAHGGARANSIWTAATMRATMAPSMTLGCGDLRKSIDTSNASYTSRYHTIADQFALESLFGDSTADSAPGSTADSCDTGFTSSSRAKSMKSAKSVRFDGDDFVESGLVGYNRANTNSSIASSDGVGSPRTYATDTTESSYCSWKSPTEDFAGGDSAGYFNSGSCRSKQHAGKQWRQAAAAAPKRKSALKQTRQSDASDGTEVPDQDGDQRQQQEQEQQEQEQERSVNPFACMQQEDQHMRSVVNMAFETAQREKEEQQHSVSPFTAAAAPPQEQQQRSVSPFAAAAAPPQQEQQRSVSPFAAAPPPQEEQQRSVSPFAAPPPPQEEQQRSVSPYAAAAPQEEQQRSVSPFAAAAAPPQKQQQRSASPFAAAAAPPQQEQQQRSASPVAAAAPPPPQEQQRSCSPFAAAAPPQQEQQHRAPSPFEGASAARQQEQQQQHRPPSPFELATRLQGLQDDDDDDHSDGGDTFTTEDTKASYDVIPMEASSLSRGQSMARANSVASSGRNPYCLWAVESTPFQTPAASEAAFPVDSGLSLAYKLKDADLDVFADATETQLSRGFSDALNSHVLQPEFLRAVTNAGVVKPVLEEMLLRAATMAPEQPMYFGENMNMWHSNWLTIKDNKWYMIGTILTYACNYGIFPAFVAYTVHSPALGTWYSLLLVMTYGIGDLTGKLMPIWKPRRPQATIMGVAVVRLVLFFLVFAVALLLKAPPPVYFIAVFLLALSGWYESMIFSLACEGHHPQDAYQIESLLAIQLDVGIAVGSVLSLAWAAGPWAIGVAATPGAHG